MVEYIYCQSTEKERKEMIISLYGNYFLLMKEFIGGQSVDKAKLKSFLE